MPEKPGCGTIDRRTFLTAAALSAVTPLRGLAQTRHTEVTIRGDAFYINGRPTYPGRTFNGKRVEGLLMNSRMVQGIFDDLNPETASRWVYPDTKRWDPDRNTTEFLAAMPEWKRHGVLAFTINLQGGSPGGAGRGRGTGPGAAIPGTAPAAGAASAQPPTQTGVSTTQQAGAPAPAGWGPRAHVADGDRPGRSSRTPRSIRTATFARPTWLGSRVSSTVPTSSE